MNSHQRKMASIKKKAMPSTETDVKILGELQEAAYVAIGKYVYDHTDKKKLYAMIGRIYCKAIGDTKSDV